MKTYFIYFTFTVDERFTKSAHVILDLDKKMLDNINNIIINNIKKIPRYTNSYISDMQIKQFNPL